MVVEILSPLCVPERTVIAFQAHAHGEQHRHRSAGLRHAEWAVGDRTVAGADDGIVEGREDVFQDLRCIVSVTEAETAVRARAERGDGRLQFRSARATLRGAQGGKDGLERA